MKQVASSAVRRKTRVAPITCYRGADGKRQPRRAVVLLVILATLALMVPIFLSVLKLAAVQRKTLDTQWEQTQAAWLAESAVERAAARLAADPAYSGETWAVSAAELAGPDAGLVNIRVEPAAGRPDRRVVRVQADYPDHPQDRARCNKEILLSVAKGPKP